MTRLLFCAAGLVLALALEALLVGRWRLTMDGIPCGSAWRYARTLRVPRLNREWHRFEAQRAYAGTRYKIDIVARLGEAGPVTISDGKTSAEVDLCEVSRIGALRAVRVQLEAPKRIFIGVDEGRR